LNQTFLMEKVRCLGGLKSEDLTKDQKAKLEIFAKAGGNGLVGIDCFPNLNTNLEEEIPSGTIFYFSPDAVVDTTLMSDNLFQTLAVSKIVEGPYEKELSNVHFTSVSKNIAAAVPQFAPSDLTLKDGIEDGPWHSELGGSSSFVGIFSQMSDDHQNKEFYVVAKGGAPASAVAHFKAEMNNNAPTYSQLLRDPEWRSKVSRLSYTAAKNVQRNLAQVAQACNVGISRMLDFSSVITNPDHGVGERAEPEYVQRLYSFQEVRDANGNPLVAFYNGVQPATSIGTKDKLFLVSNPAKDGIYVFPLTGYHNGEGKVVPGDTTTGMNKHVKQNIKASAGWNPEDHIGIMVPVVTRVFDPNSRRE